MKKCLIKETEHRAPYHQRFERLYELGLMGEDTIEKTGWFESTLPVAILGRFVISYLAVFRKLMMRWSTGDNNYCYLIVPLFFYFL
jgi:hypothetical protein